MAEDESNALPSFCSVTSLGRNSKSALFAAEFDRILGQSLHAAFGYVGLLAQRTLWASRHREGRPSIL